MRGILHVHSEYSIKDCAMPVRKLCESAAGCGAEAVLLTDHNSMDGAAEFLRTAPAYGILPVPGLELETGDGELILAALDAQGYKTLFLVAQGDLGALQGSAGHLAAFSGGRDGILSRILSREEARAARKAACERELSALGDARRQEKTLARVQEKIKGLEEAYKQTEKRTGKNFLKKEEVLRYAQGDVREQMEQKLREEKKDCEDAERELPLIRRRIQTAKKKLGRITAEIQRRQELEQEKAGPCIDRETLISEAVTKAKELHSFFEGHFYIELFFHGEEWEVGLMDALCRVAGMSGVGTVLSNDVHVPDGSREETVRCQIARALRENQWEDPHESAPEYRMKSEEELQDMLEGLIPEQLLDDSIHNMHTFFQQCHVDLEAPAQAPTPSVPELAALLKKDGAPDIWACEMAGKLSEAGLADTFAALAGTGRTVTPVLSVRDLFRQLVKGNEAAAAVGHAVRSGVRDAIGIAGMVVSSRKYGNSTKLKALSQEMARMVPDGYTAEEASPMLRQCFSSDDALDVIDMALLSEGILTGWKPVDEVYAVGCFLPCREPHFTVLEEQDLKGFGLRVLHLGRTGIDVAEDAIQEITKSYGLDVKIQPEEKRVMKDIFQSAAVTGIPYFGSAKVRRILKERKPASIQDLEGVLAEEGSTWQGQQRAQEAYECAWLKCHYPREYMVSVLRHAKWEDYPELLGECKKLGIEVIGPDINRSMESFRIYEGAVMFGLGNVKGVGPCARGILAHRDKAYTGFTDFLVRSGADLNAVNSLAMSGALDAFCVSRSGMTMCAAKLCRQAKRLNLLRDRIAEKEREIRGWNGTKTALERLKRSRENDMHEAAFLKDALDSVPMPDRMQDTTKGRMEMERQTLSVVLSPHPMDPYRLPDVQPVSSIREPGQVKTAGVIQELTFSKTKKGRDMARFSLEDTTGSIRCVCYPKALEQCMGLLKEGTVLKVFGDCTHAWNNEDVLEISVRSVRLPYARIPQTFLMAESMKDWETRIFPCIRPYLEKQGSEIILYNRETGKAFETGLYFREGFALQIPDGLCLNIAQARKYFET